MGRGVAVASLEEAAGTPGAGLEAVADEAGVANAADAAGPT
jgi:hypothetical protein